MSGYRTAACLLLFTLPAAIAAGMQIEVIALQNRTADDIIPVISPLLPEGASITGMNNQLIVKSSPESIARIKELIAGIDRRPRRFLITVRLDNATVAQNSESTFSGRYDSGDVAVQSADTGKPRGIDVTVGDENGEHVRYRAVDETGTGGDRSSFRVQTVEGRAAFIQSGVAVPIPRRDVAVLPGKVVVQDSVEYHDATSGFYVLPRVAGEHVTLLVSPYMTRVQPGRLPAFDVQSAETTLTGRLGEWMALGGIERDSKRIARDRLAITDRRGAEMRTMLIRVEEIP